MTAEFRDNEDAFNQYYDEIEVNEPGHPKGAILERNRNMVDRADLVVCYIEHLQGGAYQGVRYAQKAGKKIINLYPLPLYRNSEPFTARCFDEREIIAHGIKECLWAFVISV